MPLGRGTMEEKAARVGAGKAVGNKEAGPDETAVGQMVRKKS